MKKLEEKITMKLLVSAIGLMNLLNTFGKGASN